MWTRTRLQIDVHRRIRESLDQEHRDVSENVLQVLLSKLQRSIQQIQRVLKDKPASYGETQTKRLKYALVKDSIDEAINNLETWQKKFDPSWYLMLRMATNTIDKALTEDLGQQPSNSPIAIAMSVRQTLEPQSSSKRSVFMSEEGLEGGQITQIPHSSASLMLRPSKNNVYFVIDSIHARTGVNAEQLKHDIRDLARKLSSADPLAFGLLKCHGVIKPHLKTRFRNMTVAEEEPLRFIFSVPSRLTKPKSLRHLLVEADQSLSLSVRFGIAQQVAQSVSFVHTYGFVHKGIRPEKFIIFQDESRGTRHSFLVGFDKFRNAMGISMGEEDVQWDSALYRHPQRQGMFPEQYYVMQHDIYSIGVCLLEIGMWQSLVTPEQGSLPSPASILDIYDKKKYAVQGPNGNRIEVPEVVSYYPTDSGGAQLVQNTLIRLAKTHLPSRMGDKYTGVVVNCLTCLDADNTDFGDPIEFEDEDGIAVGVRYIEKVRYQTGCKMRADCRRCCCN